MENLVKWCQVCLFLLFFSGCAAWRAGDVGEVNKLPQDLVAEKKVFKASLQLKLYEYHMGEELDKDKSESTKAEALELSKKAYKESGLFEIVDQDSPNKQISIEMSIIRKKESSLTSDILTAATLYLIPKSTNEEITVSTKFFNKSGELIGMVEKKDTVVIWHQTFMIFAFPFNYPSTVKEEMITDLSRSIILEAITEGYFVELDT